MKVLKKAEVTTKDFCACNLKTVKMFEKHCNGNMRDLPCGKNTR